MDTSAPVCKTRQGEVRGRFADERHAVAAFLGIPCATSSRFGPPEPVEPWDGVRPATAHGPTAPKAPYPPPLDTLIPEDTVEGAPGESPLNLNVWTPSPGPGANLPVMVWIHGGAFANGSGSVSAYDGAAFARDGVVCVTLNYRLGASGFLHLDGVPDNRGLRDQVAALTWVRDNIAAFGGDPDRVTVFGESAGAMAIGVLIATGMARGLFHRAVLQSGAAHHWVRPASARLITNRLAEILSVPPTAEAFAEVPEERLLPAQTRLRGEVAKNPDPRLWGEIAVNAMPFEPVVEDLVPPGPDCGVDLLVGTNREEYRLFLVPTGAFDTLSQARLHGTARLYGVEPDEVLPVYRRARPCAGDGEIFDAMVTDWFYRIPAIRLAEAVPGTRLYEFAWRSPVYDGRLGACHASELGFVFDRLHDPCYRPMLGEEPPQDLADALHGAWVAFARTGDPGWPAYGDSRTTRVFGDEPELAHDLRPRERALWEGLR